MRKEVCLRVFMRLIMSMRPKKYLPFLYLKPCRVATAVIPAGEGIYIKHAYSRQNPTQHLSEQ